MQPVEPGADEDEIIAYLNRTVIEGDGAAFAAALGRLVRNRGGMLWLSRQTGIERTYLHRILSGDHNPGINVVFRILAVLGITVTVHKTDPLQNGNIES